MSGTHHPPAPAEFERVARAVVDRCTECVREAVRAVDLAGPAFGLCLFPSDDSTDLAPANVALGVEPDRERTLTTLTPFEAFDDIWNPTRYRHIALDFQDPNRDPVFSAASEELQHWFDAARIGDPPVWVLEEVAAALTRRPPIAPVTDDFVAWVFLRGDDLTKSLRWLAPPEVQEKLAAKRLLVDDPMSLDGPERYRS